MLKNRHAGEATVAHFRRCRWGRRWISITAAYALALHVVVSGLSVMGWHADADAFGLSSICHQGGGGPAGDPTDGNGPTHQELCALCTMVDGTFAILDGQPSWIIVPTPSSDALTLGEERFFIYFSPTGQYSRGPPGERSVVR
jgi:hypothetical protein